MLNTCLYVVLKVTNDESYTSASPVCLHGMDRDNFTFIEVSLNRSQFGMDNITCCLESFASLRYCIFNCFIVLFAGALHVVHHIVFF